VYIQRVDINWQTRGDSVEYRRLGNSDLQVSVVGVGTWAMGNDFFGSVDDEESIRAIRDSVDQGINLVDTAPPYGAGHSEEVVGRAISGIRDRVVLATKVGVYRKGTQFVRDLEPASIRRQMEDSLRRLNVDVIDLYQIHWPDTSTPLEKSLEALAQLQKEGKFRHLGVSNFSIEQMDIVKKHMNLVSLQPHYSLLERTVDAETLPYCRSNGLGVLGYGTLAAGVLTGKFREIPKLPEGDTRDQFYHYFQEPVWSRAQRLVDVLRAIGTERSVPVARVAIAWAIQQPGITCALVGAKNTRQALSNAEAGDWRLTGDELKRIEEAHAVFAGKEQV